MTTSGGGASEHVRAPRCTKYIYNLSCVTMYAVYIYIYTNMLFVSRAHAGMSTASAAAEGQGF